jgi:site-specific recombinase XerD
MNVNALEGRPGEQILRVSGKGAKPRTSPVEAGLDSLLGRYLDSRKARFAGWRPRSDDPLFVAPQSAKAGDAPCDRAVAQH